MKRPNTPIAGRPRGLPVVTGAPIRDQHRVAVAVPLGVPTAESAGVLRDDYLPELAGRVAYCPASFGAA